MISIVICSTQPDIPDILKKNISETIGVDYELIVIDNSSKENSIFSAYNNGLKKCKYPNICFMHQDVIFHSKDWGKTICKHLEDSVCGIVGISGGTTVPRIPSPWSFYEIVGFVLQSDKNDSTPDLHDSKGFNTDNYKPVITLDGVFLCARQEVFNKIRFDEELFKGFHCYDIDICLQAYKEGFENRVVNNILLEHYSLGKMDKQWLENSMLLCDKWRKYLPISTYNISEKTLIKKECKYMTNNFLKYMVRASYNNLEIKNIILKYIDHVPKTHTTLFRIVLALRIFCFRLIKKPSSLLFIKK